MPGGDKAAFKELEPIWKAIAAKVDKKTGKRVGAVPTRVLGQYGLMTYLHQGKQYIVLPRNGGYTTMALP